MQIWNSFNYLIFHSPTSHRTHWLSPVFAPFRNKHANILSLHFCKISFHFELSSQSSSLIFNSSSIIIVFISGYIALWSQFCSALLGTSSFRIMLCLFLTLRPHCPLIFSDLLMLLFGRFWWLSFRLSSVVGSDSYFSDLIPIRQLLNFLYLH